MLAFSQLSKLNLKPETDASSNATVSNESLKQSAHSQLNVNLIRNSASQSNRQFNEHGNQLSDERAINDSTSDRYRINDKLSKHLDDKSIDEENLLFEVLPEVHILDLKKDGFIKPHVDAVRFCGSRIIGLSLCSDAVMRLANLDDKEMVVDALLKRRSLYMMIDFSRYDCTHEILADDESLFRDQKVPRDRRISLICRCSPDKQVEERLIPK